MKCSKCGATIHPPKWVWFASAWFYAQLKESGFCRAETATRTGMAPKTVRAWIDRLQNMGYDIPEGVNGRKPPWTRRDTEVLLALRAEGRSLGEIADKLGRSYDAVAKKASRLGC